MRGRDHLHVLERGDGTTGFGKRPGAGLDVGFGHRTAGHTSQVFDESERVRRNHTEERADQLTVVQCCRRGHLHRVAERLQRAGHGLGGGNAFRVDLADSTGRSGTQADSQRRNVGTDLGEERAHRRGRGVGIAGHRARDRVQHRGRVTDGSGDHVPSDEPVPHFTVLRADRDAATRRLQTDEATLARRHPDGTATVARVRYRRHARSHCSCRSTTRPAGAVVGIPRVARGAVRVRLSGDLQSELGSVRLPDDYEPGLFELVELVGVLLRDVADLLQQLVAEVQRYARKFTVEVFHQHRHSGERTHQRTRGAVPGSIVEPMDHRVEFGVHLLDARDRGVDHLSRAHLAGRDQRSLRGGVECGQVGGIGHGTSGEQGVKRGWGERDRPMVPRPRVARPPGGAGLPGRTRP